MRSLFNLKSKRKLANYYSYEDLPLKVYCDIARTKDLSLLCRSGVCDGTERKVWEAIVKKADTENKSLGYYYLVEDLNTLVWLLSDYIIVKSLLWELQYKVVPAKIEELKAKGYVIDCTNNETYRTTLYNNLQVVNHLVTKIRMKKNEMELDKEEVEVSGYDQIMASLLIQGIPIAENITYARFVAINQMIKKKNADGRNRDTEE